MRKMAAAAGRGVFVVSAKRTPFGTFGGKLKGLSATELSAIAASAALRCGGVRTEFVDSVVIGNVAQVRRVRLGSAAGVLGFGASDRTRMSQYLHTRYSSRVEDLQ